MTESQSILDSIRTDAVEWVRGWINPTTGQGTDKDKSTSVFWGGGVPMHPETLESLFAFNDLAHAIVVALPEWGLRHGWDLSLSAPTNGPEEDVPAALAAQLLESGVRKDMDRLDGHKTQLGAAIWGNLHGGGIILLGCADGRSSADPLDEDNLQAIEWIRFVPGRREVIVQDFDQDINSGRLGQAITYRVQELHPGIAVQPTFWHHTRVIVYPGAHTPPRVKSRLRGWDLSVLDRVVSKLSLHDSMWDQVGAMLTDSSQGVWKIQGLFNAVLSGNTDKIEARFAIADKARSLFRSILIDADKEDFTYVTRQFAGVADLLAQSAIRTAAAAQIPVTVLFGQSPAGLNATGESDIRLWYDRVEQYQEDVLRSRLERLLFLIMKAKSGPTGGKVPDHWKATFKPVRKATPMEDAEVKARQAQTDVAYINAAVLAAAEVAVSRFTSEGWSPETQIDVKARALGLKDAVAALVRAAKEAVTSQGKLSTGGPAVTPPARQLPPPGGGPTNT